MTAELKLGGCLVEASRRGFFCLAIFLDLMFAVLSWGFIMTISTLIFISSTPHYCCCYFRWFQDCLMIWLSTCSFPGSWGTFSLRSIFSGRRLSIPRLFWTRWCFWSWGWWWSWCRGRRSPGSNLNRWRGTLVYGLDYSSDFHVEGLTVWNTCVLDGWFYYEFVFGEKEKG